MPKTCRLVWAFLLLVVLLPFSNQALAADATGVATLQENAGAPVDYLWVLVCGFLVFFMQAGFAMVEAGFCRAKNATNLMSKNLIDFVVASLVFFGVGYGLLKGADNYGLIGVGNWFLRGEAYDVGTYLDFFWQLVFAGTAATIVSGTVAERLKFSAYLIYTFVVSAFIYPVYGHWVWGGGWLSQLPFGLGHLDFAGSGVVHLIGGMVGLAGTLVLGPRYGKFGRDGRPRVIPGHSITLAALGTFILWFGWFGFNPGSTFSAHHLRIAVAAVNTNLAAAAGSLVALFLVYAKTRRWDLGMALNGVLGGLVAITASAAWVEAWAAVVIGAVAGLVVVQGVYFLEAKRVDDPVGAVSVHGLNGIWGLLAVGLFADGTYGIYSTDAPYVVGFFYGGGTGQLVAQLIGAAVATAWAFGLGLVLFKIMDVAFGIRVSPRDELEGLDLAEHGTPAYPEFSRRRITSLGA